ncbi:MAG: N-acetyl-gamma-glutamyl-phosphate reductase [Chthoniobacterales bacterium]
MNPRSPVKVSVVGASGYVGEELVRLLLRHPQAQIIGVSSRQHAGRTIAEMLPRLAGLNAAHELRFSEEWNGEADVVFLALPHGVAAEFAQSALAAGKRVIDLSADFRTKDAAVYEEFYSSRHAAPELLGQAIYGLPEFKRDQIAGAKLVACPGCYPTSILIPLLPLVQERLVRTDDLIADSLSGVSGAGRKADLQYLFPECNESLRAYGVPKHRHLSEIEQELSAAAGEKVAIQFTPHLVPVSRGILTTIYARPSKSADAIGQALKERWSKEPFVRLLTGDALPDTKNVTGTNFIEIAWRFDPRTGRVILFSAEDNIVKGASGQAVQCFNIMCGFEETAGLV